MPQAAMGTKIKIGTNFIAGLKTIGGLDLSADTIDVTTLDNNGNRQFIQGLRDGGEVSLSGFFESGDVNGQQALYVAYSNGSILNYSIIYPASIGAEWDFSGIVTKITTEADLEGTVTFEATIKVSGAPALGLTPSAGLSALSLSGTGGVLSPTFSNGTQLYAFTGVTATSVTVTATAAGHTLKLYADGVYVQDLTSGTASGSIQISAGSKRLTIVAQESGKVQKAYEIVVIK